MTVFHELYASTDKLIKHQLLGHDEPQQQHGHTYLATVAGVSFYEHGKYGDECSMLFKHNGTFYYSGFYDMPSFYEAEDMKNTIKQYS